LQELLSEKETLPIFGTSELRHGQGSGYHADTIFKDSDMKPIFIGEAGYQSLSQAITLGSLGDDVSGKKIVLIVSPQWYKPKGVIKSAFGNAFSEDEFIAFLQNDAIASDTKKFMIGRVKSLVKGNDIMTKRIDDDVRWYANDELNLNPIDAVNKSVHTYMVQDKAITGLATRMKATGVSGGPQTSKEISLKQDFWNNLNEKAEKQGEKIASDNPLGMYDKVYKKEYKPMLDGGDVKDPEYKPDSIEDKDLESFLQICKQEKVEPLVIVLPFNGYWYDAIGYKTDRRTTIYKAIDEMCKKYQANFVDLSAHEYDKYYFEDNSHPALKGLVDLNETIYKFYRGNEK
jgi:D-alanine transfer protein